MTLIGEQGFIGVPETDISAVETFTRQTEHEIGKLMGLLVPTSSIFFDPSGYGEDLTYTFSAAVQYPSPDNPGVVVSAFLTRDINHEVSLYTYSTPSIDSPAAASLPDALLLKPGVRIDAVERRTREGGKAFILQQQVLTGADEYYRPGGALSYAWTIEQRAAIYESVVETLHLIEIANEKSYGTPHPNLAGREGRPSLETLAGYIRVPLGQPRQDGRYSRARYFLRSELSAELLQALDSRSDSDIL